MYLNSEELQALKILLKESNSKRKGKVRSTGRKARAISKLNKSLKRSNKKIQSQRKEIDRMFDR